MCVMRSPLAARRPVARPHRHGEVTPSQRHRQVGRAPTAGRGRGSGESTLITGKTDESEDTRVYFLAHRSQDIILFKWVVGRGI